MAHVHHIGIDESSGESCLVWSSPGHSVYPNVYSQHGRNAEPWAPNPQPSPTHVPNPSTPPSPAPSQDNTRPQTPNSRPRTSPSESSSTHSRATTHPAQTPQPQSSRKSSHYNNSPDVHRETDSQAQTSRVISAHGLGVAICASTWIRRG